MVGVDHNPTVGEAPVPDASSAHVVLGLGEVAVRDMLTEQCDRTTMLMLAQTRLPACGVSQPASALPLPVDRLVAVRLQIRIEVQVQGKFREHHCKVTDLLAFDIGHTAFELVKTIAGQPSVSIPSARPGSARGIFGFDRP